MFSRVSARVASGPPIHSSHRLLASMSRLRAVAVSATAAVGFLTVLLAFVLARVNGVYLGGLVWPFLSDLGRDPPGSYVIFFGLNIVAVLLGLTWTFNHEYKMPFVRRSVDSGQISRGVRALTYASGAFGILGAFGLPVFASFTAPPAMHDCAAVAFVVCEALAMLINTYLNYRIFLAKRDEMESGVFITDRYGPRSVSRIRASQLEAVKRSFVIELASVALFAMSVGIYLPVLYSATPAPHLTIAECVAKGLGETYCSSTMRLNDTDTKLWNYENDLGVHQMRALAQLGCVLSLLTYALSFVVDNREDGEDEAGAMDKDRVAAGGSQPLYYYHHQRPRVIRRAASEGGTPRRPRAQSSPSTRKEKRAARPKLLSGQSDGAIVL